MTFSLPSPSCLLKLPNISGGGTQAPEARAARGSGGMLPRKFWNLPRAICDLRISRIIYFLQQTNAHWEYNICNVDYKIENRLSLYLETSKCFTFQSHHSKFLVIKLSLEANIDFIGRSFCENFPNSCLITFCFQHFIQVCFYFLEKKLGGTGPLGPSPCYGTDWSAFINRTCRLLSCSEKNSCYVVDILDRWICL